MSAEVAGGEVSGDGTEVPVPRAGISGTSGWLVIHADDNGEPGAVLGHAPLRDGVDAAQVTVPLDEPVGSGTLYAMVHADGPADDRYSFPDGDPPVEVDGNVVVEAIQYTVSGEQGGAPLPSSGGPNLALLVGGAAALVVATICYVATRLARNRVR